MFKTGLKLWSTNLNYIPLLKELYARSIFDYVELFTVAGSVDMVDAWKALEVPYVLHAPHSYAGLNLADRTRRHENIDLADQVGVFAGALKPSRVIFHPGILYDIDETIFQLNGFKQTFSWMPEKAIIENKPGLGLNGEKCLGASVEEMKRVLQGTGLGFCFDVGHAICYSVLAKTPWERVVDEFLEMKPAMFHVCDGRYSEKDMHLHLGQGEFDLKAILKRLPADAMITIETPKDSTEQLDDFVKDAEALKRYVRN